MTLAEIRILIARHGPEALVASLLERAERAEMNYAALAERIIYTRPEGISDTEWQAALEETVENDKRDAADASAAFAELCNGVHELARRWPEIYASGRVK